MVALLLAAHISLKSTWDTECRVGCPYEVARAVGGVSHGEDDCLCLVPIDRKGMLSPKFLIEPKINAPATKDERKKSNYDLD